MKVGKADSNKVFYTNQYLGRSLCRISSGSLVIWQSFLLNGSFRKQMIHYICNRILPVSCVTNPPTVWILPTIHHVLVQHTPHTFHSFLMQAPQSIGCILSNTRLSRVATKLMHRMQNGDKIKQAPSFCNLLL